MKNISSNIFILSGMVFCLFSSSAHTIKPFLPERNADKTFQSWAQDYATKHQMFVSDWWSADLGDGPQLEHVAFLCPRSKTSSMRGVYLVEYGEFASKWEVTLPTTEEIQVSCDSKVKPLPSTLHAKESVLRIRGNFEQGTYEIADLAFRNGNLVLVRTESRGTEDRKPVVTDYDRPQKQNIRLYPTIANGELVIPLFQGTMLINTIQRVEDPTP